MSYKPKPPIHLAIRLTDHPILKIYLHSKNLVLVHIALTSEAQSGELPIISELFKKLGALLRMLLVLDVGSTKRPVTSFGGYGVYDM